jgi:hypothetical protein
VKISRQGAMQLAIISVGWLVAGIIYPAIMARHGEPSINALIYEPPAALSFGWGFWSTLPKAERGGLWGYVAISALWLPFLVVPALATFFVVQYFR